MRQALVGLCLCVVLAAISPSRAFAGTWSQIETLTEDIGYPVHFVGDPSDFGYNYFEQYSGGYSASSVATRSASSTSVQPGLWAEQVSYSVKWLWSGDGDPGLTDVVTVVDYSTAQVDIVSGTSSGGDVGVCGISGVTSVSATTAGQTAPYGDAENSTNVTELVIYSGQFTSVSYMHTVGSVGKAGENFQASGCFNWVAAYWVPLEGDFSTP